MGSSGEEEDGLLPFCLGESFQGLSTPAPLLPSSPSFPYSSRTVNVLEGREGGEEGVQDNTGYIKLFIKRRRRRRRV